MEFKNAKIGDIIYLSNKSLSNATIDDVDYLGRRIGYIVKFKRI